MSECNTCPVPLIQVDVNHILGDIIGERYGISPEAVHSYKAAAAKAFNAVKRARGTGWLGWTELPYNQKEIVEDIEQTAKGIAERFESFVVLGIGGSALGPIAVHQALKHLRYNELSREQRGTPRFYVEDNIDPERMQALLDVIDVKTTCFNIVTKSGATAETMSQYLIISELLKKDVGDGWQQHIIATTDKENGNLIKLAKKEGFKHFFIPSSVGGRFSELSPVGLLPAAVCGIDIKLMLNGAACMDQHCASEDLWENPALDRKSVV